MTPLHLAYRRHAGRHVGTSRLLDWATYLGAKVAMSYGRDVRAAIFERVLSFSRELNHFGAPSLITRNTNDVLQVQTLVLLSSTMFVAAPITMIGGIIMALHRRRPVLAGGSSCLCSRSRSSW